MNWLDRMFVKWLIWKMASNRNVGDALTLVVLAMGVLVACAAVAASIVTWGGK